MFNIVSNWDFHKIYRIIKITFYHLGNPVNLTKIPVQDPKK